MTDADLLRLCEEALRKQERFSAQPTATNWERLNNHAAMHYATLARALKERLEAET